MTRMNRLSRDYLLSDEFKHESEERLERFEQRLTEQNERRERRRRLVRRLTLGLLGR